MIVGCVRNPDILRLGGYTLDNLSPQFFSVVYWSPLKLSLVKKKRNAAAGSRKSSECRGGDILQFANVWWVLRFDTFGVFHTGCCG